MSTSRTVAVTGAHGFVGRSLVAALVARGHRVLPVQRTGGELPSDPEALRGADAVIHLAGESIDGRWSEQKKRAIHDSRIEGTRRVVDAMRASSPHPAVFISASATGYYGNRGDDVVDEHSSPGDDFLARVCADWEREAARAEEYGIRTVRMRTGIVLDSPGGALEKMAMPFRFGAGGPLGSGKQFFPWIHRDDLVNAYMFALENESIRGAVNAVAPDYTRNARLAQALGASLNRPALLPAPSFALRAVLGEFAESILGGQLVIPAALEDAGFTWTYDNLEAALSQIYYSTGSAALLHAFAASQPIARSIDDVFAFFSDPQNLEAITPPQLKFRILRAPRTIERGSIIEYRLSLRGVPFTWKTLISRWNPPHEFEDVQLSGPYALWRHRHRFTQSGSGTTIDDDVTYALPFNPLSKPANGFVASEVAGIFAYRRSAITRLLPA